MKEKCAYACSLGSLCIDHHFLFIIVQSLWGFLPALTCHAKSLVVLFFDFVLACVVYLSFIVVCYNLQVNLTEPFGGSINITNMSLITSITCRFSRVDRFLYLRKVSFFFLNWILYYGVWKYFSISSYQLVPPFRLT